MSAERRAQDAYCALCRLYGDSNAQTLMRVRGACHPNVARLARAIGRSRPAVMAAMDYRLLTSMHAGYRRLMTAGRNDGSISRVVESAGCGRKFTPWEIDTAVAVVAAVVDARNGVLK